MLSFPVANLITLSMLSVILAACSAQSSDERIKQAIKTDKADRQDNQKQQKPQDTDVQHQGDSGGLDHPNQPQPDSGAERSFEPVDHTKFKGFDHEGNAFECQQSAKDPLTASTIKEYREQQLAKGRQSISMWELTFLEACHQWGHTAVVCEDQKHLCSVQISQANPPVLPGFDILGRPASCQAYVPGMTYSCAEPDEEKKLKISLFNDQCLKQGHTRLNCPCTSLCSGLVR